ncbi:MAG TPA: hypothetical protein PLC37_00185 [Smithellaceae bacterium]|nr:hypothetical protein [Smithellaceae bacterium]HQG79416.1 hypothetical protein [Smithellaceae bacterium]
MNTNKNRDLEDDEIQSPGRCRDVPEEATKNGAWCIGMAGA